MNIKGKIYNINSPVVMGILNVTPDSFFDGGRYTQEDAIKSRLDQIITEGASIIDIGAYSSRPGADDISVEEEWRRLEMGLNIIAKNYPDSIVSVDTFRSQIARRSVEDGGVAIINDISAGEIDPDMFDTVADLHVPYILMHMKGTPQNMQIKPQYDDVMGEVISHLSKKVFELRKRGVADIIIDPGFGFGKSVEHNYEMMKHLEDFKIFEMPILVGISRKSMIYKVLNNKPQDCLNGTSILNTLALCGGANILRVHDVKEAVECIKLYEMYQKGSK